MDSALDKILERARSMETDPPRSKLDGYAEVIWELRRKRKRIRTIAAFLNDHGIPVHRATVARWLKSHPIPKSPIQDRAIHPSPTLPQHRGPIDEAARDFFKPTESSHEKNEPNLWNCPD
jgi:hypothetical protein